MLRSLRKAAATLEKSVETAFSTPPSSHTAFVGTTFTIAAIKIKLGPVFAEGGYSLIHIATPVSSSSTSGTLRYAVKRVSCEDPEARNQAECEVAFLRRLPSHPNIVKFYDAVFQHNHAFLLFELVDGGTLPERLKSTSLDTTRRLSIFADAVAAVTHLHAQNPPVAVRDVKLENLLFDRINGSYKLCDFGSVTTKAGRFTSRKEILAAQEDVASNCTAMYRAPELVDLYSKQFICERVDVWALGCVWYAILFGTLPFDGQSSLQISKGLREIPSEPKYPDEYISLLKGMLTVDPAERLDSFFVLEAVRRSQGKEIEPQLQSVGLKLRKQRACDYGLPDTEKSETCSSTLSSSVMPTSRLLVKAQSSSSNINSFQESGASRKQFSTYSTTGDEGEGWADFDAAFGEQPSAAQNTTTASSSRPPTMQNPAMALPGSIPQHVSGMRDMSTSLIDFSDLHVTHPNDRFGPTNDHGNERKAQSNSKGGMSTSNVADLIDFG